MTTYYRQPTRVQAVQWSEDNEDEMVRFAGDRFRAIPPEDRDGDDEGCGALLESAHDSWMLVRLDQWVVKDPAGAFSLLGDDEFTEQHSAVDGTGTEEKRARLFRFIEVGAEEEDMPGFAAALDDYLASVLGPKMQPGAPESQSVEFDLAIRHDPDHDLYEAYADGQNMGVALFTSTPEHALDMARDIVRSNVFARSGCMSGRNHLYLSTGCFHGDHVYCASEKGISGAKTAASCKQCASPCVCICHVARGSAPEEKSCTCPHPADEHSVYGCTEGCGCEWMPVRLTSTLMKLREDLDEARTWARHGYESGQQHCSWSDYGVAPAWLADGWPPHFSTCTQLRKEAFDDHARELAMRQRTDADLRETEGQYQLARYGHELADLITPDSGERQQ